MNYTISTYSALLNKYGMHKIPYEELLLTKEWYEKRETILKRDKNECKKCGSTSTIYINRENHMITTVAHKDWGWLNNEERLIEWDEIIGSVSDKPFFMHVHHKYYVLSKLPWEYPDDALVTLCNWCHLEYHKENSVDVFEDSQMLRKVNFTKCSRCYGAGWFPQYKHVENGVCFECRGERFAIE